MIRAGKRVKLTAVGQVSLYVRDVARAEVFYGDTLGLAHLFTFGELAFFDADGVRLYLQGVPEEEWRPSSIVYFDVRDIRATRKRLIEQGVAFTDEPRVIFTHPDGTAEWMSFFDDPEGNQLALMSRVPRSGASASEDA